MYGLGLGKAASHTAVLYSWQEQGVVISGREPLGSPEEQVFWVGLPDESWGLLIEGSAKPAGRELRKYSLVSCSAFPQIPFCWNSFWPDPRG